jgi:murein DD-endopeptidase MepM/ murein hydrolase activator NlpD
MLKTIYSAIFVVVMATSLVGQREFIKQMRTFGGGQFKSPISHQNCLSDDQRKIIIEENIRNIRALGLVVNESGDRSGIVSLGWPLKKTASLNAPGYYLITNFVDHDPTSGVIDYNCGSRSYNGHKGTDFAIWPFPWYKQLNNQVEVIAAEAGIIINKFDGNFDMNCQWINGSMWNAVYIRHSDGSVAWYGHLKSNSLTSKSIGQTVAKGEYLGIVGSSGFSSGPHLHFELYQNSNQTILVDPFAGSCNSLNGNQTWWQNQHPYLSTQILDLLIHTCNPNMQDGCPANNDILCEATSILPGATLRFSASYRQQRHSVSTYRLKRPDGSIYDSWTHTPPQAYDYGSWWYWIKNLPTSPTGAWTYEVSHNGETETKTFNIGTTLPGSLTLTLTPQCSGNTSQIRLNWTASANATSYQIFRNGSSLTTVTSGTTEYIDTPVTPGTSYSYYMRALNSAGGTNSNTLNSTAINCTLPGALTLTLTPQCNVSTSQIRLNWTASANATSYQIFRNGSSLTTVTSGMTEYIDTPVTPGTSYSYYMRALNSAGGTNSNTLNSTAINCTLPGALTLTLMPQCNVSTSQIRLSWTASANATSYQIFRNGSSLTTVTSGMTEYIDTPVTPGTSYSYYVRALNSAGGTNSNTLNSTAINCTLPGELTLTLMPQCNVSTSQIRLNWTASANATSYQIFRNGSSLTTVTSGMTEYIDTPVTPGTSYSYYVRALNSAGGTNSNTPISTALSCTNNIELIISSVNVLGNQIFEIDVTVRNFIAVSSAQFSISWNNQVAQFIELRNLNTMMQLTSNNFNTMQTGSGRIGFQWDSATNLNLSDNSRLFTIRFTANNSQSSTPIQVTGQPTSIYFGNASGDEYGVTVNNGTITVPTDDYNFETLIKMYPNPTSGIIFLESGGNQISEVTIMRVAGQEQVTQLVDNSIDMSNFNPGVYFVKGRVNNVPFLKKLVLIK